MNSLEVLFQKLMSPEFYMKNGFIVIVTFLLLIATQILFKWFSRKYSHNWFGQLIAELKKLTLIFVAVFGFFEILAIFADILPEFIKPRSVEIFRQMVIGLIVFIASLKFKHHFLKHLQDRFVASDAIDSSLFFAADKLLNIVITISVILFILDLFGVPINTLLAAGGIGGFAVSWASKDVIANFFGGLMIFINRPFVNGDWIASPNKHFEGVVENIGWYRTQIRTFERRPEYIPNSLLTDAIVQNPGRMYNRRIKENIGLRYEDLPNVKRIIEQIREYLNSHEHIDQNQIRMVHFMTYGAYSLDINIYCFTVTTNWAQYRDVQQDVLLGIADIVQKNGANFAFPTQTIYASKVEN